MLQAAFLRGNPIGESFLRNSPQAAAAGQRHGEVNMRVIKNGLAAVIYAAVGILTGAVLLFSLATVISFRQYEQNDLFDVTPDRTLLLLLFVAGVLLVTLTAWRRTGEHKRFPWPMMLTAGGMSLFFVLVIRGLATNDALQLDAIMQEFSAGNYDSLQTGGYLFVYPFQVTYVLLGQVIAALCGPSDYLAYQLLNVLSILVNLYLLHEIAWELFQSPRVCTVMQILSMGCWFYYVFATFVYSDLWSFALQTAALYLEIRYLRQEKIRKKIGFGVGAGVCIAAAILLKTNGYVALIAMIFILFWDLLRKENGRKEAVHRIALTACFLLLTFGSQRILNGAVASAAGLDAMPKGTPAITYIAMGMQETEGKCGWYNGTNVGLYRNAGYDAEKTAEAAGESIEASIGEFRNSGRYFVRFYIRKFLSQWGDPTCVSMREMEETKRHDTPSALSETLIFGTGSRILQWGMNVMHSVIYLGMFLYLWVRLKKSAHAAAPDAQRDGGISSGELLLVVFILGGMLFHQLWEASGRYTMRYYLTMLPPAAWGIHWLCGKIDVRLLGKRG